MFTSFLDLTAAGVGEAIHPTTAFLLKVVSMYCRGHNSRLFEGVAINSLIFFNRYLEFSVDSCVDFSVRDDFTVTWGSLFLYWVVILYCVTLCPKLTRTWDSLA